MVYSNRFVMCLVVNGEVIADKNGFAKLPFGTEYSIRLRNKHHKRRCVAYIFIDGENVSGPGYVIQPNDFSDIHRHHDKDRGFKIVHLDSPEATDAGKNGPNDDKEKGTIEVRFYLERERVYRPLVSPPVRRSPPVYPKHPWNPWNPSAPYWMKSSDQGDRPNPTISYEVTCKGTDSTMGQERGFTQSYNAASPPLEDACTVEGSATGQTFGSTYIDIESNYVSCVLHLQGYHEANPEQVFVHQQEQVDARYCENCGSRRRKKAKFCSNCGQKL